METQVINLTPEEFELILDCLTETLLFHKISKFGNVEIKELISQLLLIKIDKKSVYYIERIGQ